MLLLPLLATAAAATAPKPSNIPASCERVDTRLTTGGDDAPIIRPLDRMPPARLILGVLRHEGGCLKPIVLRDAVGLPGAPRR